MPADNPRREDIPQETMTPVATAIIEGSLNVVSPDTRYFVTYRLTGESAPTWADDKGEFLPLYYRTERQAGQDVVFGPNVVSHPSPGVDVYVYCPDAAGALVIHQSR